MRVLHITNNYPTEKHPTFGIFVKEQIDSLSEIGVLNSIFFVNGKEKGVKEYSIKYFKLIYHLAVNKYDVVHCHHSLSALLYVATLAPIFTKSVMSFQSDPSKELRGRFFYLFYLFFNKLIIKNNNKTYIKYKKCINFPNGVDISFFKPMNKNDCLEKLNLSDRKKYVLFFDSNKGKRTTKRYDIFKETIFQLKKNGYDDLEEIVLTNTKRSLIPYYINAAELHILCSDFEGSPNSVKECMACNTKVVSTNVGNVEELFSGSDGYFVSKTNNVHDIMNCVELALKVTNVNGREILIKKQLDINSVALKLRDIYNSI